MLRHPAAVIASKQRWYGGRQGDTAHRGLVNQTLFTERATREAARVFIRYDDLLEDWTPQIDRAGVTLDLDAVRGASAPALRSVHDFVDRGLSRSPGDWDRLSVPDPLRLRPTSCGPDLRLAGDAPEDDRAIRTRLDELRAGYAELYGTAEAIAHSSVAAARAGVKGRAGRLPGPALWVIRRVPVRYRKAIPPGLRARVVQALKR